MADDATDFAAISALYQQALGRPGTQAEWEEWLGYYRSAGAAAVLAIMRGTPEGQAYAASHPAPAAVSDLDFVKGLYHQYYFRASDAYGAGTQYDGAAWWANEITTGRKTRAEVAGIFSSTPDNVPAGPQPTPTPAPAGGGILDGVTGLFSGSNSTLVWLGAAALGLWLLSGSSGSKSHRGEW
jgi:hypothetical protein